jgi:HD-GYP domain-containing protein (c-di-GMP phosphodiesterase class II)
MKKTSEEIEAIMAAALTMNIAMLRQHDLLAHKEDPLTDKESELIKGHAEGSVEQLKQAGVSHPDWLAYVRLHHENEDGSGYPIGKGISEVPQNAKIVAYADRYCAAVVNRKYRKTLLPNAALRDVLVASGKPRDPLIAAYFIKELGTYPPGAFVRLQNGEIGVVTRRTRTAPAPVVHSFIGPRGAPLSFPIQRDTSRDLHVIREIVPAHQVKLCFSMQQLWGDEAAL